MTNSRKILTYKGVTGTLSELARHFKVPYSRAYSRFYRKLPLDIVFSRDNYSLKEVSDKLTHRGVTGTLPELAKHFGVKYATAYYRLHSGKSLDEVFSKNNKSFKGKAEKYTYKGVTGTLPDLAKYFGVDYSTAYSRLQSGKSLDVVFSPINSKYDKLTYKGVTGTLPELAKHFGVLYATAYNRLQAGKSLDVVFSPNNFKFDKLTYRGVTGTLPELVEHFGVDYSTAYNRLVSKKPLDVVFSNKSLKPTTEILTYRGLTGTLSDLCKHFDVDYSLAYSRLKSGKCLDIVFSNKGNLIKDKAKQYTYRGVTGTLPDLAKYFEVEYHTARRKLRANKPLDEVFNPKYHKKNNRKNFN